MRKLGLWGSWRTFEMFRLMIKVTGVYLRTVAWTCCLMTCHSDFSPAGLGYGPRIWIQHEVKNHTVCFSPQEALLPLLVSHSNALPQNQGSLLHFSKICLFTAINRMISRATTAFLCITFVLLIVMLRGAALRLSLESAENNHFPFWGRLGDWLG